MTGMPPPGKKGSTLTNKEKRQTNWRSKIMQKTLKTIAFAALALPASLGAAHAEDWSDVLATAKGQTVYFNAWGGAENINAYIDWAGDTIKERYGVTVEHVKLSDTADAVTRVLAERAAGRKEGGAIDLIWINGENFAAMKREGLLLGKGWAETLPNYKFADIEGKSVLSYDFTVSVDGQESPWGTAQLTFYHDSAQLAEPPKSLDALANWIAANPGRFTYAAPPNFIGSTFLKQLTYGLVDDPEILRAPATPELFEKVTAPVWAWLDKTHPDMWRSGRVFAADTTQLKNLLADGETSIAMTFNPGEASSAINEGLLPETVRSFVLDYGSLGNAHFVTIPFNANAKEGAMVLANFLLSPEAQAKKQDEKVWGDPTVLSYNKLDADGKAAFDALEKGPATLGAAELGKAIAEPDSTWTEMLEAEWAKRYASGR